MSTPTVPRAPRAPIILAILLLVVGGAGIGAWQAGWLTGLRRGAGASVVDASSSTPGPASAPAPTGTFATTGALAVAAPAVATAPSPSAPVAAKAPAAAVKAATAAAPTGARKPPRDIKVARAPQKDAGVRPPPPPPPPPPVKVVTSTPQLDAGVATGRDQAAEQATISLLKARVALLRGDLDGALRELEAARRLRENAAVHVGFAEVYARQGNTLRALAHWQKAVNLSPRDPTLRVRFAEALARAGEIDEACAAVRAALTMRPQHARGVALQGRLGCAER